MDLLSVRCMKYLISQEQFVLGLWGQGLSNLQLSTDSCIKDHTTFRE